MGNVLSAIGTGVGNAAGAVGRGLGAVGGAVGGAISSGANAAWSGLSGAGGWIQNALSGGGGNAGTGGLPAGSLIGSADDWATRARQATGVFGSPVNAGGFPNYSWDLPPMPSASGTAGMFQNAADPSGVAGFLTRPVSETGGSFWDNVTDEIINEENLQDIGEALSGTQGIIDQAMALDAARNNRNWQQLYPRNTYTPPIPRIAEEAMANQALRLLTPNVSRMGMFI